MRKSVDPALNECDGRIGPDANGTSALGVRSYGGGAADYFLWVVSFLDKAGGVTAEAGWRGL